MHKLYDKARPLQSDACMLAAVQAGCTGATHPPLPAPLASAEEAAAAGVHVEGLRWAFQRKQCSQADMRSYPPARTCAQACAHYGQSSGKGVEGGLTQAEAPWEGRGRGACCSCDPVHCSPITGCSARPLPSWPKLLHVLGRTDCVRRLLVNRGCELPH